MKLGKIFILVLSLLMLRITSYRFDEYNRTIVLDDGYCQPIIKNNY